MTRRDFVRLAGAGGTSSALFGPAGCEVDSRIRVSASPEQVGRTWSFRSRPDLKPPPVGVTTPARGVAPGYVFAAPKNGPGEAYPAQDGPMILDDEGRPVWFRPVPDEEEDAMDFKVRRYCGKPVLTWWQGTHAGYGEGKYLIFDDSYGEVARLRAGNGNAGDHHELLISSRDTALFTVYRKVPMDLSGVGGPEDGAALGGIAQEVDIETGEVLFAWHSLEHVGLDESTYEPPPDLVDAFDYFHINSIAEDGDNHLLISARRTSAV